MTSIILQSLPKSDMAHTTVSSSMLRVSWIFFSVRSRSASCSSTLLFVSCALFTACASNASMALICRPTSYVAGLKVLNSRSTSSTMAVFCSCERYDAKSTVWACDCKRFNLRRASSLRFLKACSEAAVWPLRPRDEVIFVQSIFRAAERWRDQSSVRKFVSC